MKFTNDQDIKGLDPELVRTCLEVMDDDVALRFVLSGLSMSKIKIVEAFSFACKEMQYREEERAKQKLAQKSKTEKADNKKFAKVEKPNLPGEDIIKLIENLFSPGDTKKK